MKRAFFCSLAVVFLFQAQVWPADAPQEPAQTRREEKGQIVCTCYGVTDREIEQAVRKNNLTTVDQVVEHCNAGGACGRCKRDIEAIIRRVHNERQ
jgi:bacterioferritin-associated ferredoxin